MQVIKLPKNTHNVYGTKKTHLSLIPRPKTRLIFIARLRHTAESKHSFSCANITFVC